MINKTINGIDVRVDYKIEIIGILLTLSNESNNYSNLFDFDKDNEYINTIKEKFNYLVEDGTIDLFNTIKDSNHLHYQTPMEIALSLDNNYEFINGTSDYLKENKELFKLNDILRKISQDETFISFINDNKNLYLKWIDDISRFFIKYDIKKTIIDFCGKKYNNLKLIVDLLPFETNGGYGVIINDEAHYCFRAYRLTQNQEMFYMENLERYIRVTVHEFLHSIINPLTTKYNIFNFDTTYLVDPDNKLQGYENDYCMINESIVRALTILLHSKINKELDIQKWIEHEVSLGFIYVPTIYKELLNYDINRTEFESIDEFYEQICNTILQTINKKEISR